MTQKKFKERFCEENCGKRRCRDAFDKCTFIMALEQEPTAYDTNKIVEQLEDIHLALEKAKKEMLIDYVYNADENIIALIRLLKGGGVNE